MRDLKLRSIVLFLCLALIATGLSFAQGAGSQSARTIDPGMLRALEKAAAVIQASFDKNGLDDVVRLPSIMKEAGLSYDPALPATTDPRVAKGKTENQLHMLRGIYAMDVLYALAFGKRMDQTIAALASLYEVIDGPIVKDWRTRQQTIDINAIADISVKRMTELVQQSKTDNRKGREMGTTLFGFGLETSYIYAKTGLAVGITKDYSAFLEKNIPLLQILKDVYDSIEMTPDDTIHASLNAALDTNSEIVEALLGIMKKSKGKPTEADLRAILAIVEKPRAALLTLSK